MELNVRKLRKEMDLTQAELARLIGVSEKTIWNWEHGYDVPAEKITEVQQLLLQYQEDMKTAPIRSVRNEEEDEGGKRVPLLPINAIGGGMNDDEQQIMPWHMEGVTFSPFRYADMAIRVSGDSMYPRYPNGCTVFVRKIDFRIFIEWGSYYVLSTRNGTIIKRVMKGEEAGTMKCVSVNPDYDDFTVSADDVFDMYKVLGSIHSE